MVIVHNYALAVVLCFVIKLCWGSWGIFVWKEFKGSDKKVYGLFGAIFCFFIVGLSLIVMAGN